MRIVKKLVIGSFIILLSTTRSTSQKSPYDQVYQYSVLVGSRRAFLWIPPDCRTLRGVIISLSNLLERNWLEDPIIRKAATQEGLAIIWVGPNPRGSTAVISADLRAGEEVALQKMMKDLADESGYAEIQWAPFIPMGHSANGQFSWSIPNWNAERTIASIPVKTVPLPASMKFDGVPLCYVVGETTEWPQFRVPDPATQPGDRDFFWPVVKESASRLRARDENNLVSVVTDPGGGHFDWSPKLAKFVALFIRKACDYRLPNTLLTNQVVQLKKLQKEKGWLTDVGGMNPDSFPPAPYSEFKGDPKKAYWCFDEETARAAIAFNGDRKKRERQMLTFVQNGEQLSVAKQGFAPLKFQPENDGVSFKVDGDFLTEMPRELIGAGKKLGHAPGAIKFSVIDGPAIQTGPNTFRIQFNRGNQGGAIWLQEEHQGNEQYRRAVQPGQMTIPAKLTQGKIQTIQSPQIADIKAGTKSIRLNATSDSGLPVNYYVVAGPAVMVDNKLVFTKVPVKSKWPIKVTVVAYQWGRTIEPLFQSAEPVTKEFFLVKK